MKLILITAVFCTFFVSAKASVTLLNTDKEKRKTETKNEKEKIASEAKNFHSIKKWKVTIEHDNGDRISKIIQVKQGSKRSAMETAFNEAERYLKTLKKVKTYSVSPVSKNSFVLLVGGE